MLVANSFSFKICLYYTVYIDCVTITKANYNNDGKFFFKKGDWK